MNRSASVPSVEDLSAWIGAEKCPEEAPAEAGMLLQASLSPLAESDVRLASLDLTLDIPDLASAVFAGQFRENGRMVSGRDVALRQISDLIK